MSGQRVISAIDLAFRKEWSPLMATLVRELRDLELAEDVAQEAFVEAARRWRNDSVPKRPGAWLLTTARRKAIDRIRRDRRFDDRLPSLIEQSEKRARAAGEDEPRLDDQLALLFGCCHPALAVEAQVALTLRSVAGLTTTQIAHAFLVPEATMAKRMVRAKNKTRAAGIPFEIPAEDRLGERLDAVCAVVYAIFTEGHASASGSVLIRGDLCDEAVWLAETLTELAPGEAEVHGLAALCLLTDARRHARTDGLGQQVLLADQDRSKWDQGKIQRGLAHLRRANDGTLGRPYRLQATLAAIHSTASSYADTDWDAIVRIYDLLVARGGGPIVELNRAVAIGEGDATNGLGVHAALERLDELDQRGELDTYHYLHTARGRLLLRIDRREEAAVAFERALATCDNESEQHWLRQRLAEVRSND